MIRFTEWLKNQSANWVVPNIQQEMDELQRTASTLNVDQNQLLQATKNAKLISLDEKTWRVMKNTDSYRTWSMKRVNYLAKQYGRDVDRIVQGFQRGDNMPAPIVLMQGNQPYLVAGNTRLMVARALKIQPKIFLITM
jgi:predicted glycosyl hydrolase (DUF1957 family)